MCQALRLTVSDEEDNSRSGGDKTDESPHGESIAEEESSKRDGENGRTDGDQSKVQGCRGGGGYVNNCVTYGHAQERRKSEIAEMFTNDAHLLTHWANHERQENNYGDGRSQNHEGHRRHRISKYTSYDEVPGPNCRGSQNE
jgi:hypothetical protein